MYRYVYKSLKYSIRVTLVYGDKLLVTIESEITPFR